MSEGVKSITVVIGRSKSPVFGVSMGTKERKKEWVYTRKLKSFI